MARRHWKSLVGVAVVGVAALTLSSSFAAVDDKGFAIVLPHEVKFEPNPNGVGPDLAVIAGDPTKEGFYIIRARFKPGIMSQPHYHPGDRHVTVISGTWWAGKGAKFDPDSTTPLGPGSYMLHPAGEAHFDGAKDIEAIVEIKGMGPGPSFPATP